MHDQEVDRFHRYDLVIHNCFIEDSNVINDIGIKDGIITIIEPKHILYGNTEIDAQGNLVCPPFIDSHTHLDKVFLQPKLNESGSLQEAISIMKGAKGGALLGSLSDRVNQALKLAVKNGTLFIRTHVDIDSINQVKSLEELLRIKEKWSGIIDIQVVAFPQDGVIENPGVLQSLRAAMQIGADCIGGIPAIESTTKKSLMHIERMFELAVEYNKPVDMHIDETDDPGSKTLEMLAKITIDAGWQGRVNAAHCCSLASQNEEYASSVIDLVAQAGISIITNPTANLFLQGRSDHHPIRRGITRVKELMAAGVNVACGSDNLRDVFYPFGQANMLEVSFVAALSIQLSSHNEYRYLMAMTHKNASICMGLKNYGISVGNPADFVIIPVKSYYEALVVRPSCKSVISKGEILCTSTEETIYSDLPF